MLNTRLAKVNINRLTQKCHAAVILSLAFVVSRKKRRNLYLLPSYEPRLLALPFRCRTATQKPTPVYAIDASGYISPEISCRKQDNHISTGIYRCSILDMNKKFCENFKQSRISADKRFLMYFHYIPLRLTPDRGLVRINLTLLAWSARRSATAKLAIIPDILSLQC